MSTTNQSNGLRAVPSISFVAVTSYQREVYEMTLHTIRTSISKFARDEDGLTIVEYAVAGGLITVLVAAAFVLLGGVVDTKIRALCQAANGNVAC
jgi:pilus assembly protein Flp/PilA